MDLRERRQRCGRTIEAVSVPRSTSFSVASEQKMLRRGRSAARCKSALRRSHDRGRVPVNLDIFLGVVAGGGFFSVTAPTSEHLLIMILSTGTPQEGPHRGSELSELLIWRTETSVHFTEKFMFFTEKLG